MKIFYSAEKNMRRKYAMFTEISDHLRKSSLLGSVSNKGLYTDFWIEKFEKIKISLLIIQKKSNQENKLTVLIMGIYILITFCDPFYKCLPS